MSYPNSDFWDASAAYIYSMQGTAILSNSTDLVLGNYVIEGFREGVRLSTYGSSLPASPSFAANTFLGNRSAIATGHPLIFWREPATITWNDCRERIRWTFNPSSGPMPECVLTTFTIGYYRNINMDLSCNLFDPGKLDANGLVSRSWLNPSAPGTAIGIDIAPIGGASALKFTNIGKYDVNSNPPYVPGANVWPLDASILNRGTLPTFVNDIDEASSNWKSPLNTSTAAPYWTSINFPTVASTKYAKYKNEFVGSCNPAMEFNGLNGGLVSVVSSNRARTTSNGPTVPDIGSTELVCSSLDGNGIVFPTSRVPNDGGASTARLESSPIEIFNLIPNPTKGDLKVVYKLEDKFEKPQIHIVDMLGRNVILAKDLTVDRGECFFNLQEISGGLYLVRLVNKGKLVEQKRLSVIH